MELLNKLGIDWKLLIAQLVNFGIVLLVLYKFLYKPLLSFLGQRREQIAKSLVEAKQIEASLQQLEITKNQVLAEARRQSQTILEQTTAEAQVQRQEILTRVKAEAAKVIDEARVKIVNEQDAALALVREQAARLVSQAVVKVFGKLNAADVDKQMIDEAIKEVARRK